MKLSATLFAAAVLAAASTAALAQEQYQVAQPQQQGLTRAQVRQELKELEEAGYNPSTANDYDYPQNIQAAEARVAAKHAAQGVYSPMQQQ
jgi:hypothetical protein